jgi:hypothetical protein
MTWRRSCREKTPPEWLRMSHMSVLGACWCRPILGERSILGAGLILEEKVYFWSAHLRRQERNMQKKKEKNVENAHMQNGLTMLGLGFLTNIVTAISQ